MIRCIDVRKVYRQGKNEITALDGVSLDIARGEFAVIMGPSGSGKSTLLNLIAGLDTPTSGAVMLAGQDLADLDDDARSALRLRSIGFVFQNFNLFPSFSVEENVAWPLEFLGVTWRAARSRAAKTLQDVGLPSAIRDRRPAEISGGEQQRVAIARALVTGPKILLADEPTGNLDSRTGQKILDLLRALNIEQSLTVVMVTHSAFTATYGHRTVNLRDGHVVGEVKAADGRPSHVVPLKSV